MSTANDADAWLYADNRAFITGEREFPVNKDEILHNLKTHYGVYDLSIFIRIPCGVVMLFMASIIAMVMLNTISRILLETVDFLSLLTSLLLIFMLYISGLAAYVAVVLGWRLLLPPRRKLQSAWEQLTATRTVCAGRIVFDKALSVQQSELEYEFLNPQNKRIQGKYRCEKTLPFIFDKQGIRFDDSPTLYPNTKPETVMVWYASDKVHTLL